MKKDLDLIWIMSEMGMEYIQDYCNCKKFIHNVYRDNPGYFDNVLDQND